MFRILHTTFATGIATVPYPKALPVLSEQFRGRPEFDFKAWQDARPAADACPTGAISLCDQEGARQVIVDYGRCILCGQCADVSEDGAVRITRDFELATRDRCGLILTAEYTLNADGTQRYLRNTSVPATGRESIGREVSQAIRRIHGRSRAIREVDAGSCNGSDLEIIALTNPVHTV